MIWNNSLLECSVSSWNNISRYSVSTLWWPHHWQPSSHKSQVECSTEGWNQSNWVSQDGKLHQRGWKENARSEMLEMNYLVLLLLTRYIMLQFFTPPPSSHHSDIIMMSSLSTPMSLWHCCSTMTSLWCHLSTLLHYDLILLHYDSIMILLPLYALSYINP